MSKIEIVIYLDIDTDGNDLLDSAGSNISAGWYRYEWPLGSDPVAGPFHSQDEAGQFIA